MEVGVVELRMHVLEMNLNVTCLFGSGLFATVCLAMVCLTVPNAIALHNCDDLRVHAFILGAVLGFHSSYGERTSTGDEDVSDLSHVAASIMDRLSFKFYYVTFEVDSTYFVITCITLTQICHRPSPHHKTSQTH